MTGDYGGLRALLDASVDEATYETSCPICGTPVDENDRGVANCPLGHWRGRRSPEGYTAGPDRV